MQPVSTQPREALDLASSYVWSEETGRKAMRTIAANARDASELIELLEMCGLHQPKPLRKTRRKHRAKQA